MKSALVIIDVQKIMFSYEGGVYKGVEVLDNIYYLLTKARREGVPVIFIQHTSKNEGEIYSRGKETWEITDKIAPIEGEAVIEKNYWDAFQETTLLKYLEDLAITNLIIAGMQTEFCVDTTSRRAFSLGFKNILAEDAHSTFDAPILKAKDIIAHHNRIWGGRFVTLKKTIEIKF